MSNGGSGSPKRGLGRGLAALLGEDAATLAPVLGGEAAAAERGTFQIPVEYLHPGKAQPRRHFDEAQLESLAESVRVQGLLQPILVRPHPKKPGEYEIVAGERRWRAAQKAQLYEVPVVVRELDDGEALELALVENVQRQDLDPIEEAEGYRRLMEEFGHSQEELARIIGKSRPHIANTLRLLNLPDRVKELLRTGQLSAGHARALLGAQQPSVMAEEVVKAGLSVRETERLVATEKAAGSAGRSRSRGNGSTPAGKDADTLALESDLTDLLGMKVKIEPKGQGGALVLHYRDLDQLDELLGRLHQTPR